jgi:hypothetical protein
MKLHTYLINYSVFVNGTEYPHEKKFYGHTLNEAKSVLEDRLKQSGTMDYHIGESLLIK